MKPKSCCQSVRAFFKKLCFVLLTLVILVLIPPLSILVALIYIYRTLLISYTKAFQPEYGKIMSARSSLMATDDIYRKPKANLLIALVLKGHLPPEEGKNDLLTRLVNLKSKNGEFVHPELQQYPESHGGYCFWKWEQNFNIDDHCTIRHDPVDERAIDVLATEMLKRPFPKYKSPWEFLLFQNWKFKEGDADRSPKTLILFHLHHSMADGFSVIKLLASDMAQEEKVHLARPNPLKLSVWRRIRNNVIFILVSPYEMVSSLIRAWDTNDCHIRESQLSDTILLAFSERTPISVVKEIKNAHDVGFTAVLLAAFSGAVREFMLENGFRVPENIHGVIPFPLPGHSEKLRNFMTTCFIKLPIGKADPVERLKEIDAHLISLKKSTLPFTMAYLLPLMGLCPVPLARQLFKQVYTTALLSNFPGPTNAVKYGNYTVQDVMFTAGLLPGNIGLGFNTLSYNGFVRIQAAFNEAIPTSTLPRTYLLDKVKEQLQILANHQLV